MDKKSTTGNDDIAVTVTMISVLVLLVNIQTKNKSLEPLCVNFKILDSNKNTYKYVNTNYGTTKQL